jgi:Zn-dependent protease
VATPFQPPFSIPYLLIPGQIRLDDAISFVVAVLVATLVNAEAQAFAAILLGDTKPGDKTRLHFNAFLHLDILGSLCFLLGGFGWPRRVPVDDSKFRHPRLYLVLARIAGPLGNFIMANIAASIAWLFATLSTDPRVFFMLMAVNVTMAVFNLVPIPPLAGGAVLTAFAFQPNSNLQQQLQRFGPFLIVALVAADRVAGWNFLHSTLDPMIQSIFEMLKIV